VAVDGVDEDAGRDPDGSSKKIRKYRMIIAVAWHRAFRGGVWDQSRRGDHLTWKKRLPSRGTPWLSGKGQLINNGMKLRGDQGPGGRKKG